MPPKIAGRQIATVLYTPTAATVTVTNSSKGEKRLSVYLLEAKPASVTKLFEDTVPVGENLSIDQNLSPLLEHAIFSVQKGEFTFHLVLPPGTASLIRSTDLDDADREGLVGPKWAASGSAFYIHHHKTAPNQPTEPPKPAQPEPGGSDQQAGPPQTGSGDPLVEQIRVQLDFKVSGEITVVPGFGVDDILDAFNPAPPPGELGIELTPENGVLRQVRSPGPWEAPSRAAIALTPHPHAADVTAGPLIGRSQSLWLTSKDNRRAILVSPSAENSWLFPDGHAIAYTVDGALFVRSFKF